MFNTEKIFLFLLIGICLMICIVVVDSVIEPDILIHNVYAAFSDLEPQGPEGVFMPELQSEPAGELSEALEGLTGVVPDGWQLFRSEGFAFEIQFPKAVVRKSILNQDALNSGIGLDQQAPVWEFRLNDAKYYQGTNLVDASLLIHVLEGKEQESSCSSFKAGSLYQTPNQRRDSLPQAEINEVTFWKDEVIEGVMGEFYHRISYRTFAKGACYELTQLLHYRNLTGLTDQKVAEFDLEKVTNALDEVMGTFTLLDLEPTFPEQSYPLPKTTSLAVSKAASDLVDGLDVSHWQGTINWTKVAGAGYAFTFAKGTEGVGWTDVKFHTNMTQGTAAGVLMGAYHFARPDLGNKAADEANYFVSVAGDYLKSGYLRPVLDLEVGGSLGKTKLSAWVLEWMQTVESKTGISPLIYTNKYFIDTYLTDAVTEYDLWIAYWSCQPTVSYDIPPTGKWRDWAFWQYYGPGGCGGNAGYVPGITTNIDLNIFNGVEAGLQEYNAATTQVWVSLTSDAYLVPAPYYADITANVNGDYTGLVDFSFWWDCDALEADRAAVEAVCGPLPVPAAGSCLKNENGQRCIGVANEKQLAEYTYTEIGNYTAKVIVEIGGKPPVEDRYKISTYNPIRTITNVPLSPAEASVDLPFTLASDISIRTSVAGALQLSLGDPVTGELEDSECVIVPGDALSTRKFSLAWTESTAGEIVYQLAARYRPQGTCPIEEGDGDDNIRLYIVNWVDDNPLLELSTAAGDPLAAGSTHDLGELEPFQTISQDYQVSNLNQISEFQITGVEFQNLVNVLDPAADILPPVEVGPGESLPITNSFGIPGTGPFSFDVLIAHDAANPTPFVFTVQGEGILSGNPLNNLVAEPASPGKAFMGDLFDLQVSVELDAPAAGSLQLSLLDEEGTAVGDPLCQLISGSGMGQYSGSFSWTEGESGLADYSIWARYRPLGDCPVEDLGENDLSLTYQLNWQEDSPTLELADAENNLLPEGAILEIGNQEAFATVLADFVVRNTSATAALQLTGVQFENALNVLNPSLEPEVPIQLGPGEEIEITLAFEVESVGGFSFDLSLDHNAATPTPYTISIQGTGVLSHNPIQSITPDPVSPGQVLIGDTYQLQTAVDLAAPAAGALVLEVRDGEGNPVQAPACQDLPAAGQAIHSFATAWSELEPGLSDYTVKAGYFALAGCPVGTMVTSELEMSYQIDWQEENPVLELLDVNHDLLASGSTSDLGQFDYYQNVVLNYLIRNTSRTNPLEISDIRLENLDNVSAVDLNLAGAQTLDPEQTLSLELSFRLENTGDFSFDLVLEHTASNPSPYLVTFQGRVVMSDNPIKFVVPTPPSPGSSLIGETFPLRIDVGLDVPDQGALQVNLLKAGTETPVAQECQVLNDNLNQARTFNLSWSSQAPGDQQYTLWTRYRAQGDCPVLDSREADLSQVYAVSWEEEIPVLEVRDENNALVSQGSYLNLGTREFFQEVELAYTLANTSTTTALDVSSLSGANLLNLDQVEVTPAGPFTLEPAGQQKISVAFQVKELGQFGFDLGIYHNGENPSPFLITTRGSGVMSVNPILSLAADPTSPGAGMVSDPYQLEIRAELDPPAEGALEITLENQASEAVMDQTCLLIPKGASTQVAAFNWEEFSPGESNYTIRARYQALGLCPLVDESDADLTEAYQVSWQINSPVLAVNRPEGVTIFDGAVDYVGVHDFFRFVEVTYVIDNDSDASPLIVESITPQNLVNLREVLVEPAEAFEVGPGESQLVKINFQVLMLEPFSFDLVWEHNGANPSPYQTAIQGEGVLNLGDIPVKSWLYRFLDALIRSGFFLTLPIFGSAVLFWRKKTRNR